jgi:hypothetical protein
MEIVWRPGHTGQSWVARDADGFIRGEVVGYGQQVRPDAEGGPRYGVAFARREQLPG